MKKVYIVIILFFCALANNYAQKSKLDVYDYWPYYGDMSNSLYKQLCSVAFEQIDKRNSFLSSLETDENLRQYSKTLKGKYERLMGPFPEKTPLNPVITGKIEKDDFTVEKIYFESRPNYYVTAALFIPTKGKGKKPAVLYCSGHSKDGFRNPVYQRSILNIVKKGFIVLAFDPIGQGERIQYFDKNGKSFFDPTHEHSYPGTQSFIAGLSPANYFVWDGIRAIDYLVSRKEVDSQRIGVTGRSGGGTQTAYIAAMDDRVVASAPECYITSYDMLLKSKEPQDAEQVLMYSLKEGIGINDLIGVRAPKPTLMITTTQDIFSIQGAQDVFNESQKIYKAYGKSENLQMVEDDAEHASTQKNREALYAFFQQYLNNPGNTEDLDVDIFDEKDLWVTPNGQIQQFIPSETIYSLNQKYTEPILKRLQEKRTSDSNYIGNLREKVIEVTGYKKPATSDDYIFSGRFWRDGYAMEKYMIKGQGSHYVPLLRLLPDGKPKDIILMLDEKGKSHAVNEGLVGQLVQEGYEVIVPDLCGIGEMGGGHNRGDSFIQGVPLNVWYAGVLTHKTPIAIRMEEVICILDFIEQINTDSLKITGIASGTLTSDLVHSALVDNRFEKIALINPLYSYVSLIQERDYRTKFIMSAVPGVVTSYDLPDLVSAITPMKVLMINPVNSLDNKVRQKDFGKLYETVRNNYAKSGNVLSFTVEIGKVSTIECLIPWL